MKILQFVMHNNTPCHKFVMKPTAWCTLYNMSFKYMFFLTNYLQSEAFKLIHKFLHGKTVFNSNVSFLLSVHDDIQNRRICLIFS